MIEEDLKELLEKTSELKAIEFLRDVIIFVREVKPILDNINDSLFENVQHMPLAKKKLAKVTQATEYAAIEIMDLVDVVSDKIAVSTKLIAESQKETRAKTESAISLIEKIKNFEGLPDNLKSEIDDEIDNLQSLRESKYCASSAAKLSTISADAMAIMMALQVQDVTSQQIAAATHILSTIQKKLAQILQKFKTKEIIELLDQHDENSNTSSMHREIAFDPDAIDAFSNKSGRQELVDQMMRETSSEPASFDDDGVLHLSNEDIDALMKEAEEETKIETKKKSGPTPKSVQFTKDALDALLKDAEENKDQHIPEDTPERREDDKFSQDDIDELFGK